MELIRETSVKAITKKDGTLGQRQMHAIFKCPRCGIEVEKPRTKGKRDKTCGSEKCKKEQMIYAQRILAKENKTGPVDINKLSASNKKSPKHSLYQVWRTMRQRCNKENSDRYINYGARGIKVCNRWNNSYKNFEDDMGEEYFRLREEANGVRKLIPSIDRIDNNGNYEPSNCRWITYSENSSKDKRIPIYRMDFDGNILEKYDSATYASENFVVTYGAKTMKPSVGKILEVCRGTRSEHLGYKWAFATNKTKMSNY